MKNILLVAGLNERYYFDPFVTACRDRDIRLHVCDPTRFPREANLHVHQDENGDINGYLDTVLLFGEKDVVQTPLSLSEIDGAWYLRENHVRSAPELQQDDLESRFIRNETRQALRALFSMLNCRWVNKRESIETLNSNKLYQQALAVRCGLSTPRTIISNAPDKTTQFSESQGGLLLKTMGYIQLDEKHELALYSERFSHEELLKSASAIQRCPVYAQEYVEKRYEYRVMVIGSRVLACRIDSQSSPATRTDWRHYDFDKVEHRQVDLPADVAQKLRRFMDAANLRYGAIDLIENLQGDFVFLEVNPSGQWGWIADLAGIPVARAVAEMLEAL